MCNSACPFPGLWIGAGAILIRWSAVTCRLGFSTVDMSTSLCSIAAAGAQHDEVTAVFDSMGLLPGGPEMTSINDGAMSAQRIVLKRG